MQSLLQKWNFQMNLFSRPIPSTAIVLFFSSISNLQPRICSQMEMFVLQCSVISSNFISDFPGQLFPDGAAVFRPHHPFWPDPWLTLFHGRGRPDLDFWVDGRPQLCPGYPVHDRGLSWLAVLHQSQLPVWNRAIIGFFFMRPDCRYLPAPICCALAHF